MAWRYFMREEFACKCGRCENKIKDSFIDRMEALRERCGFALPMNSGYRCPDHNDAVSETGRDGPHTTGEAGDVGVNRAQAHRVVTEAGRLGFTGIGIHQRGKHRFVHLDTLVAGPRQPRPTVWSY